MYHLLKNPTTLQKAVEEVDHADKEGRLSDTVTWQEAGKLPYFQACVKEALRESQSPPNALILPLTTVCLFMLQVSILQSG
jgi:cytochrome P450